MYILLSNQLLQEEIALLEKLAKLKEGKNDIASDAPNDCVGPTATPVKTKRSLRGPGLSPLPTYKVGRAKDFSVEDIAKRSPAPVFRVAVRKDNSAEKFARVKSRPISMFRTKPTPLPTPGSADEGAPAGPTEFSVGSDVDGTDAEQSDDRDLNSDYNEVR